MANGFTVQIIDSSDFIGKIARAAKGDFKKELAKVVDGLGAEFLRIIEDEIIRLQVVDTRLLLNSFHQGHDENIWKSTKGGLTLEVGTNVEYAAYVNDGHWTNKQGQDKRWIPGRWDGSKFIYEPGAKTGMLLKQKFIEGKHYFDNAVVILEKMFPALAEKMLENWAKKYFG